MCYVFFYWSECVAGTKDVFMTHRFDRLTQNEAYSFDLCNMGKNVTASHCQC